MKNKSLSENLKYQRKLKGYTQERLADVSNIGIRTIQRIEKGEVQPHMQTIVLLSDALGINVNDLIVIENPNEGMVERKWLFLFHSLPFLGFIIPLGNVFIPLIVWAVKSKDHELYNIHGKAIINFHCTINLLLLLSLLLFFVFPGYNYFLAITIVLYGIIMSIINVLRTINHNTYVYPLSIPFISQKRSVN